MVSAQLLNEEEQAAGKPREPELRGAGLTSSSPWSCSGMRTHARPRTRTLHKARDSNATHCQDR